MTKIVSDLENKKIEWHINELYKKIDSITQSFNVFHPHNKEYNLVGNNLWLIYNLNGDLKFIKTNPNQKVIIDGDIIANNLTASNIIYSLIAGNGISISQGQNPIISNTGVLSLNNLSGDISLQGTTNQINVNTLDNNIILSTPQDIHTGATPTFAGLYLSNLTQGSVLFAGQNGLISQNPGRLYWDNVNELLGIGTNTLKLRLNIFGGIFARGVVGGDISLGNIGSGAFLVFYPRKGAFRAGAVYNNQWDDDNIGYFSFAGGRDTIASGLDSISLGNQNTASNDSAVALGYNNTASGEQSFAAGLRNIASGRGSVAIGYQNTASGNGSVALGYQSYAQTFGSVALGVSALASGYEGVAIGDNSQAIGSGSIALGFKTKAGSLFSIALGAYNLGVGNPTSWVDTDPILELGIGTSDSNRKNALTILKNGNVGIGTNPQTKLDIAGAICQSAPDPTTILFHNTNESGTPSGDGFRIRYDNDFYGSTCDALIIEKTDWNQTDPDGGISFVNTGSDGIVEPALTIRGNGNVGIGSLITNPSEKLVVGGNIGLKAGTDAFIGTLDNCALSLKTNNVGRIFITNDGKIRIGQNTSSLNLLFTVNGDIETTGNIFFTQTTPPFIGTFNAVGLNIGIKNRPVIIVDSDCKVIIGLTGALNNAQLTVLGNIGAIGNIFISKGENAFIGTLDNYALSLRTNNVDRIYITNDGKVGIGTTEPSEKLEILGKLSLQDITLNTTHRAKLWYEDVNSIGYSYFYYGHRWDSNLYFQANSDVGVKTFAKLNSTGWSGGGASLSLYDYNGNERISLNTVGNSYFNSDNVGIGTTTPSQKLTVAGNIGLQAGANAFVGTLDNYAFSLRTNNTDRVFITNDGRIGIGTTNPTGYNSKLAVEVSDTTDVRVFTGFAPNLNTGYTVYLGLGKSLTTRNSGWIGFKYVGDQSTSNFITFGLYDVNNILVITGNRNVGIRNTSPTYAFQIGSAGDGSSAIANAWNTYSDIRLKEIVGEIKSDEALEKILNLQAKRFYYKNDENKKELVGFIAQEVEEYIPEVISTDSSEEKYKAIAYDKLIPFLVEAIKQLHKELEEVKQWIKNKN